MALKGPLKAPFFTPPLGYPPPYHPPERPELGCGRRAPPEGAGWVLPWSGSEANGSRTAPSGEAPQWALETTRPFFYRFRFAFFFAGSVLQFFAGSAAVVLPVPAPAPFPAPFFCRFVSGRLFYRFHFEEALARER